MGASSNREFTVHSVFVEDAKNKFNKDDYNDNFNWMIRSEFSTNLNKKYIKRKLIESRF